MAEQIINCPKCGAEIKISEAITKKIRDEIENKVKVEIEAEYKEVEKKLKEEAEEKIQKNTKDLEEQLKEKDEKINSSYKEELSLRKKVRELEDKQKDIDIDFERRIDKEREKILDEQKYKDLEKEKTISDLKEQINELKRRAEQGSVQMQGEVVELDFESMLKAKFPLDNIKEVPKGAKGADVIQKIFDLGNCCGTIIWELKNTKSWSDSWIEKTKENQRDEGAELAVIVTKALPSDIKAFGNKNGVWVCSNQFASNISEILRSNLISISQTKRSEIGKDSKMETVYNYLSSHNFKHRVEAIVDAFITMKEDLDREKMAIQKNWAAREKQIEKILANTSGMYGDIQGIIGASLPRITNLELQEPETLKLEEKRD